MVEPTKFEVGGLYKNMKGVYEVVSIHKDSMVIRWENGSEVTTTIDQQQRIIERMTHEKELLEKQRKEQKKASKPKRKA